MRKIFNKELSSLSVYPVSSGAGVTLELARAIDRIKVRVINGKKTARVNAIQQHLVPPHMQLVKLIIGRPIPFKRDRVVKYFS